MSEILTDAERRDLLGMTAIGRAVLGDGPDLFDARMRAAAVAAGLDQDVDDALALTELGRRALAYRSAKGKKGK